MGKYRQFGELLEQSIKKRASVQGQTIHSVQQRLMEALSISQSALYDWRNGEYLPQPELIPIIARIFVQEWQFDQKWLKDFLEATNYQWFDRLAEVASSARGFGMIGLLAICWAGWWLTRPFLAQPFATLQAALEASLSYGLAALIAPLLLGLLARPALQPANQKEQRQLWLIRCANAYAGYYVLTVFCFGGAVIAYAFGLWPWPPLLQLCFLVLPPLLFAYATAGYRTTKIIRNQPDKVSEYISTSKLLLAMFAALNLLIPIAFYGLYLVLSDLSMSLAQDPLLMPLVQGSSTRLLWPHWVVGALTLLGAAGALMLTRLDRKAGRGRGGIVLLIVSALLCLSAIIWAVAS